MISYAELLLRKYSVPQDFSTSSMMRDRILLEEIPHGTAYFDDVVESMRTNTVLIIEYQRYECRRETLFVICRSYQPRKSADP